MPFKDTPDGQTHYQNDGCGMTEHNTPMSNEIEKKVEEFTKDFTYGVLYSASSDLSAGDGTHFRSEDAIPAIDWLRQAITDIYTLGREEALKEAEEVVVKMKNKAPICYCKTHPEHNCGMTSNEALDDAIKAFRSLRTKGKKV